MFREEPLIPPEAVPNVTFSRFLLEEQGNASIIHAHITVRRDGYWRPLLDEISNSNLGGADSPAPGGPPSWLGRSGSRQN